MMVPSIRQGSVNSPSVRKTTFQVVASSSAQVCATPVMYSTARSRKRRPTAATVQTNQ